MKNLYKISIFCTSLVFFFYPILRAAVLIIPSNGSEILLVLPVLAGIISFSGSLLWIREMKKESKMWYFGIPHSIALFTLIIFYPLDIITGTLNLNYFTIVLGILSITSVGFFLSFPDSQRKITRWFALIPGAVGIYAVITIYYLIQDLLSHGHWHLIVEILAVIYWLFFLPLIGLCYVAATLLPEDRHALRTPDNIISQKER